MKKLSRQPTNPRSKTGKHLRDDDEYLGIVEWTFEWREPRNMNLYYIWISADGEWVIWETDRQRDRSRTRISNLDRYTRDFTKELIPFLEAHQDPSVSPNAECEGRVTPQYRHPCEDDTFLTRYEQYDLYLCDDAGEGDHRQIVVRYGHGNEEDCDLNEQLLSFCYIRGDGDLRVREYAIRIAKEHGVPLAAFQYGLDLVEGKSDDPSVSPNFRKAYVK